MIFHFSTRKSNEFSLFSYTKVMTFHFLLLEASFRSSKLLENFLASVKNKIPRSVGTVTRYRYSITARQLIVPRQVQQLGAAVRPQKLNSLASVIAKEA